MALNLFGKERERIKKKKVMKLKKAHWIGIGVAATIIILALIFTQINLKGEPIISWELFAFLVGISFVIVGLPFLSTLIFDAQEERNKEQMFLEFSRDLVEGVRSGTPISKSILNVRTKDYGALSPHINKLANQISLGIPIKDGLETFAKDVKSKVISRAITLIKEAERAGGEIQTILESVVTSVSQIEKLRKERKAAIYNLSVQGYIIFIIFIIIMLVMQFKILPITEELGIGETGASGDDLGISGVLGGGADSEQVDLSNSFLFLLITQGFFAGLVIGKISEGKLKAGYKHSFILVALSWLISKGASLLLT